MTLKEKIEELKQVPREDLFKCKYCNYYDKENNQCILGHDMKKDNDPIKGCWDFEN